MGVCVIFGAHRALLPIGLNDVAMTGTNTLMCFAGCCKLLSAGAALGVMFKTKDPGRSRWLLPASLSAGWSALLEPAILRRNLRLKKPMICAVIAGAVGGGIMGIGKAVNTGFANNGILTIMSYWGEGTTFGQFMAYIIGIVVSFVGAAVLTYLVGFEDTAVKAAPAQSAPAQPSLPEDGVASEIKAPVEGKAYPLNEVPMTCLHPAHWAAAFGILPARVWWSLPQTPRFRSSTPPCTLWVCSWMTAPSC